MDQIILPTIAGVSGLFAGAAIFYSKLRPLFPVKVNCWFCNSDAKVSYYNKDSFVCTSCQQYNGFTQDGGYNQDIPSMYCEGLNSPSSRASQQTRSTESNSSEKKSNGLCQTCNLNQTLKLRALADYTPIREENYDQEIEDYRKRLERTYALCRQCEASLNQTLGKQNSWLKMKLMNWRLKQSEVNKKIFKYVKKVDMNSSPMHIKLLECLEVVLSTLLFMISLNHLQMDSEMSFFDKDLVIYIESYLNVLHDYVGIIVLVGLSILLVIIFSAGKETLLISDGIASFTWVGLLTAITCQEHLASHDFLLLKVCLSFIVMMSSLCELFSQRFINMPALSSSTNLNESYKSNFSCSDLNDSLPLPSDITTNDNFDCTTLGDSQSTVSSVPRERVNKFTETTHLNKTSSLLDDTLCDLKIGTPNKSANRTLPVNFTPRSLFTERSANLNQSRMSGKSVLSPSRLSTRHVNQSSWVAGGYWGSPGSPQRTNLGRYIPSEVQDSKPLYPLSRSSSQSSGFISHCSGGPSLANQGPFSLPNSRQGSLCGDFDRNSVLSEPPYFSWNYQPSDTGTAFNSLHRHASQSDIQSVYRSPSASVISEHNSTLKTSPKFNSTFIFPDKSCDNSFKEPPSELDKISSILNYRNPWVAFFLGASIATNIFFVSMFIIGKTNFKIF